MPQYAYMIHFDILKNIIEILLYSFKGNLEFDVQRFRNCWFGGK